MDERIDKCMAGQIDGMMEGSMDGWLVDWLHGLPDVWMKK